jgi:methanogenic corrinoid protein MtbC1
MIANEESPMLKELIAQARELERIPAGAAEAYDTARTRMVEYVNASMTKNSNILFLTGRNPLDKMYANHRNHSLFMSNVFHLNHLGILVRTVPWVYRVYRNHGFSTDYFPEVLSAWIDAVKKHMPEEHATALVPVYEWMLAHHADFVRLSEEDRTREKAVHEARPHAEVSRFLAGLLEGDHRRCLRFAEEHVAGKQDLERFYLDVVQPAMVEVGRMWECGEVSVAQEHLASSMVSRVMASLYPRILTADHTMGKALVTTAPNEFHEIGARMLADLLEADGWDVDFLGANTPRHDLVRMLAERKPFMLMISVSMAFNLVRARSVIEAVRNCSELEGVRVMVGGRAFQEDEPLWYVLGADGFAQDGARAKALARTWWEKTATS